MKMQMRTCPVSYGRQDNVIYFNCKIPKFCSFQVISNLDKQIAEVITFKLKQPFKVESIDKQLIFNKLRRGLDNFDFTLVTKLEDCFTKNSLEQTEIIKNRVYN